jgi:hypothetical protein
MAKTSDRLPVGPETADLTDMLALAPRFEQLRRRSRRQWRRYQSLDDEGGRIAAAAAHEAWSTSVEETLGVVEAISLAPAESIANLAIKVEAICWWVVEDDSILDAALRRWLVRLRRSARQLAREL